MILTTPNENAASKQAQQNQWLDETVVHSSPKPEEAADANFRAAASKITARYKILSQIGTGGTGIVYKVRDLETGEIVALKVLRPGIASEEEMQEHLRKEVCLARKVTHK